MSKKKDKNTMTMRKPLRRWQIIVIITMILALTGLVVWSMSTKPVPPAPKGNAWAVVPQQPAPIPEQFLLDELSAEQHRFMQQVFLPRWDVIRRTYPIIDLRNRFDRLARRIQSPRRDVRLQVSAFYMPNRKTVLGEADREGMQPIIRFFQPALEDFVRRVSDQDTRDDIVLGMMLHEEYHLTHHIFAPRQPGNQTVNNSLKESETWWWCCDTIYAPMMRAGRLRHLPADDAINGAMRSYNAAHGDQNSAAWLRFCAADPALNSR